jgi:hypothetical protein
MLCDLQIPLKIEYRNFNLCPHCEHLGADLVLWRMRESMPMISRSDGKNFHLVLADRPLPYPSERRGGPARKLSLCFSYLYGSDKNATRISLVLVPAEFANHGRIYREIEFVADLLAEKLLQAPTLAVLYNLDGDSLRELGY